MTIQARIDRALQDAAAAKNVPGFVALDFQAELEDGSSVADKENFVLEPFIEAGVAR